MSEATGSHGVVPGDDPSLQIHQAGPSQHRLGLALLLTGKATEREPVVDQFLAFAREQKLSLEQLWLASKAGRPVAATLIVPGRGRTAMVFSSPLSDQSGIATLAQLARQASLSQDARQVGLIQALLEPAQQLEHQALLRAGFADLAHLIYMRRHAERHEPPLQLDGAIRTLTWSENHRKAFERVILASYEETLDCPGLLGMRHIDDIIAGHMATGVFEPTSWFAFMHGEEPVGVMLLNRVPQQDAVELVYLGISKPWRGKGLGRRLVNHAMNVTRSLGASSVILAVDEANTPAMRLYESLGFHANARKRAMIFSPTST